MFFYMSLRPSKRPCVLFADSLKLDNTHCTSKIFFKHFLAPIERNDLMFRLQLNVLLSCIVLSNFSLNFFFYTCFWKEWFNIYKALIQPLPWIILKLYSAHYTRKMFVILIVFNEKGLRNTVYKCYMFPLTMACSGAVLDTESI